MAREREREREREDNIDLNINIINRFWIFFTFNERAKPWAFFTCGIYAHNYSSKTFKGQRVTQSEWGGIRVLERKRKRERERKRDHPEKRRKIEKKPKLSIKQKGNKLSHHSNQ